MVAVRHKKTSGLPDVGGPELIQPSDWNDEHEITGTLADFFPVDGCSVGALVAAEWGVRQDGTRPAVGEVFDTAGIELRLLDFVGGAMVTTTRPAGELWRVLSVGRFQFNTTVSRVALYLRVG